MIANWFVPAGRMRDGIKDMLPGRQGSPGRTAADNRLFLEAVLWRVRTGSPWRDLPSEFGNWNSVFVRFRLWAEKGVFECVFKELSGSFVTGATYRETARMRTSNSRAAASGRGASPDEVGKPRCVGGPGNSEAACEIPVPGGPRPLARKLPALAAGFAKLPEVRRGSTRLDEQKPNWQMRDSQTLSAMSVLRPRSCLTCSARTGIGSMPTLSRASNGASR